MSLLLACSGCVVLHIRRDVTFKVIDGETNLPIPNPSGGVFYEQQWGLLNTPRDFNATGDQNGRLVLRPVNVAGAWGWSAAGYEPLRTHLDPRYSVIAGVQRAGPSDGVDFIVSLFKSPIPAMGLVLPDGFRGIVCVEFRPDAPYRPTGLRKVTIPVCDSGYACVLPRTNFTTVSGLDWAQVSEAGAWTNPLDVPPRDAVALRWMHSLESPGGGYRAHLFVVGTLAEFMQHDSDSMLRDKNGTGVGRDVPKLERWMNERRRQAAHRQHFGE